MYSPEQVASKLHGTDRHTKSTCSLALVDLSACLWTVGGNQKYSEEAQTYMGKTCMNSTQKAPDFLTQESKVKSGGRK